MTSIEAFMLANYTAYVQVPSKLICRPEAFIDGSGHRRKILAIKFNAVTSWRYRHAVIARFPESDGPQLFAAVQECLPLIAFKYVGGMNLTKSRRLLEELFDGGADKSDLDKCLQCLKTCFG